MIFKALSLVQKAQIGFFWLDRPNRREIVGTMG
ncbi:MAG: hypothetical protein JWL58_573 [Streptosporangiaceae bacterium]|nr:hypothetical protein [Streptosporangiaceae bacterium]